MRENKYSNDYDLLDSGFGRKLEKFGKIILDRPCAQAIWSPLNSHLWKDAHAKFERTPKLNWVINKKIPDSWTIKISNIKVKLSITDFGHIGFFPETISTINWISSNIGNHKPLRFLNLFAYSGFATISAAKSGAKCCHLDSSKGIVEWAKDNAQINDIHNTSIRWIVDDVIKFLKREVKRNNQYDAVLLDPPSFGRGSKGELFKIEEKMLQTLELVSLVMSKKPNFVILTSHTPGFSPLILENLLKQFFKNGIISSGEMFLASSNTNNFNLPNGNWARWIYE